MTFNFLFQIQEDTRVAVLTREVEAARVEIERHQTFLVFERRAVQEQRERAEEQQSRAARAEAQVALWRTAAEELEVERRIAYFRAEHYMRMHAYLSREPQAHRTRPSIPLYPYFPDVGLGRTVLSEDVASVVGFSDLCIICQETFDRHGWYTLGCGHRFHLYCLVHHMARRSSCPLCRRNITLYLYRTWGIGDLFPGRGETIDPVTRLALGHDLESHRQRLRDTLTEEGYPEDYIAEAVLQVQPRVHESLLPLTPAERAQRVALWDTLIDASRERALRRPTSAEQLGTEADFADPTLDQALMAAESHTRGRFEARVYADTRIWEMGHASRRTLADQELAYARARFERDRVPRTTAVAESSRAAESSGAAESSRAAEERSREGAHASEDIVDPTQRTVAERVVQAPRTRTQLGSYLEIEDEDED